MKGSKCRIIYHICKRIIERMKILSNRTVYFIILVMNLMQFVKIVMSKAMSPVKEKVLRKINEYNLS